MEIFFNAEALESFIKGLGLWGLAIFLLLQIVQAVIAPLPGNILTMVGGVLFGLWPSFLLAYAGNVIGSIIGFSLVRKLGRPALLRRMGKKKLDKYTKFGDISKVGR